MPYAVMCRYRPGGERDRFPLRADHLRYMIAELPRTLYGGALLTDDEQDGAIGMLVILDVATRGDAERFLAGEPYHRAGLFGTVEIFQVRQMTPPFDGSPLYRELELERGRESSSEAD